MFVENSVEYLNNVVCSYKQNDMSVIAYENIGNDDKIMFSYSVVKKKFNCIESLLNINVVREDKLVYVDGLHIDIIVSRGPPSARGFTLTL